MSNVRKIVAIGGGEIGRPREDGDSIDSLQRLDKLLRK